LLVAAALSVANGAVPDRCGVAMTITVAAVAGLIIGLALGAIITGLALTERRSRHWIVCLRLPEELHRRLREQATVAGWSFKAEIISRLQASFRQPKD
jgi:uncharacterized membrane-anchored protein YhcB (DUF1043 family)